MNIYIYENYLFHNITNNMKRGLVLASFFLPPPICQNFVWEFWHFSLFFTFIIHFFAEASHNRPLSSFTYLYIYSHTRLSSVRHTFMRPHRQDSFPWSFVCFLLVEFISTAAWVLWFLSPFLLTARQKVDVYIIWKPGQYDEGKGGE